MGFGDVLIDHLSTAEDSSDPNGSVSFKVKSAGFRRTIEKLGNKIDNMEAAFEFAGQRIAEFFILHFEQDQGPNEAEQMISWPEYSDRAKKGTNWIERKMNDPKNQGGDKLLHYTGALRASLEPGGDGNIFQVSNRQLVIGTEIGYAMFHQEGYNVKSHGKVYETKEQTKRPFIGLTDEERDQIVDQFDEFFFGDLESEQ